MDVPEERYENLEATLSATTDYAAVAQLDALTICVPTPLSKTRTPDLNFIVSAAESVGSNIKPGMLIVLQSTTLGMRLYQRMGFRPVTRVLVYNSYR